MEISNRIQESTVILFLQGRLGGFEAGELQKYLQDNIKPEFLWIVVDMTRVDYLSSAGLRVLLMLYKSLHKEGGQVILAGLQPYCQNVLDMAGFSAAFPTYDSVEEAADYASGLAREKYCLENWNELETAAFDGGSLTIIPGGSQPGTINVMGDVKDVLYSRVTTAHICSKRFSETEYSIGLGGLGERIEDYLPIMGEMMTIGGTMVWLPTDGYDTPDFLIPQKDTGQVTLRTGFNVSICGDFNELMFLQSTRPEGISIASIYQVLFKLARERRADFRGALGLAMRAQMVSVYGSGIKKSPTADRAPADGEMVTHPAHSEEWFDFDAVPRHSDVTGLICGVGIDLKTDLSSYDQEQLNRVFYLNPANMGANDQMLHNHAVVFKEMPMPAKAVSLEQEIKNVVEKGEFVDMRHLLDSSAIRSALIGVNYIQEFRNDTRE